MEWFEWSFVLYLAGIIFGIVSTVRAGRVRDPRDADGRRLPRTGDEERHAARIMRRGTIVFVAGFVLYAVSQLVTRPETLPVVFICSGSRA